MDEPIKALCCPRCLNMEIEWRRDDRLGNLIGCYECKYYLDNYYATKGEAIEAWNKRYENKHENKT